MVGTPVLRRASSRTAKLLIGNKEGKKDRAAGTNPQVEQEQTVQLIPNPARLEARSAIERNVCAPV